MASMAAAARDIPQSSPSRDNLTVVAARNGAVTVARTQILPTPPNSISPALPAHGLKAQLQKAKLEPIESDLDLHDDANGPDRSVSPAIDAAGEISCATLAKHHLPEILLNHGPLAIRHIMGYLTTSVPGFSGIAPTKARRLVVGALEGRGSDDGGDVEVEVDFEKVGWGRWGARRRGQTARARPATPPNSLEGGIPISQNALREHNRSGAKMAGSTGESFHFSHDDNDAYMMEYEVDKMSMDGSASASCSEAPDDDVVMNDDPEDVTDDEDWAAVGAVALRAESYSNMEATFSSHGAHPHTYTPGGLRSFSGRSGMARPPQTSGIDLTALTEASDAQEREAVEALLRLGSV